MKTFENREVRVFISSSFRDMHGEREVLIKHVFPRLRQKCRARGVELTEIDLRWGLTEEQTQNLTDVVRVCLEEIDLCKGHPPFFISLLGELYGTVVENAQFQALHNHKPDFEWLKNYHGASVTELEIIHAIFSRLELGCVTFDELAKTTLFYMRSPDYIKSVPASELANFKNDDTIEDQRALKNRIRDKGFLVTDYDEPEDLKNRILRQMWHAINQRFPLGQKPTPLEQKTLDHEAFADSRTKIYIERPADLQRLEEHAASEDKPLVILGESGSGKSALLANWALRYRHPDDLVILYFIGSSPDSTDYVDMLRYVMARLKAHYHIDEEIPTEPKQLVEKLPFWLATAHAQGRTILILDGLNQLTDNADKLGWLPEFIPSNVRLFLSTLEGESLEALQKRGWQNFRVAPLSTTERESLLTKYLRHYHKGLNQQRVDRIVAARQTDNPLYLRVLLEELRIFGSHEKLDAQIDYYLAAPTVIDLYEKVLSRLEADYEQEHSGLVKEAFSLLWAARRGLTQHELLELLDVPQAIWSPLFLAVQDALVNRGGLLNFYHDYLRQAVERRYLPSVEDQNGWHLRLADFFDKQEIGARVADELPWHLDEAGAKERLRNCISEIPMFLQFEGDKKYELWGYWLGLEPDKMMVWAYDESLARYEETEKHTEKHLANVLNALGLFFEKTGYFSAAIPLLRRALEISEKVLGKQHPDTAKSLNQLALLHYVKGDYSKAEPLFKRTLEFFEKVLGKQHPDTATSMNLLAGLYYAKALSNKNMAALPPY
ncbi:nephrocystin-3 [Candidatus Thiomargarita nelsonii]|uniref:Nephrocystin-3 n=1 Tax=Candidatus Thiomargarita nelsonii TaxID=1003181 RepID=A0A0A6NZV3_9GAMM|nr:nephrocystin-3 [Candidatus Thiomargarita nelsonii]